MRMEEIELPPGFSEADQARVLGAVSAFPEMKLAFWHEHAYLAIPQPKGSWLDTRLRWGEKPPSQAEVQRWSVRVASLVKRLVQEGNPLAGECLRPEAWFLAATGELELLEPGVDRLLWGESAPATVGAFGRLLEHWTSASPELATSYVWVIARCMSGRSDQSYGDFGAVLQALEDRPLVQAGEADHFTRKPVLQDFKVPRLVARKWRVTPLVLGLTAVVTISTLLLWSWLSRPAPPRAGPAVAVVHQDRLELLDPVTGKLLAAKTLPSPALAMAASHGILYLSMQGSSRILSLDDRALESARPRLMTDGPADSLSLSPDGKWLYAHMTRRGVLMVSELPDRTAFLELLPAPRLQLAPGPVQGKPGVLLVDPEGSRLATIQLSRGTVDRAIMEVSGPAVADESGGWWVASGRRLLHLDAHLRVRGERALSAPPLGFSQGLILYDGQVSRLDDPERTLPLAGTPVAASREEDGSWWVATRSPDRLVHVRKDLSEVMLRLELRGPPVGAAWLP